MIHTHKVSFCVGVVMKLHEILALLMDKQGLSDNDLADAVGMSQSTM